MGFYIFKSGDLSGNASTSFSPPARPAPISALRVSTIIDQKPTELRSAKVRTITISAQYDQPIIGWQMGFDMDVDRRDFSIKTNQNPKELSQNNNINIVAKQLNKSIIRALWYAQHENDWLNLKEKTPLLSIELQGEFTEEKLKSLIKLSPEVLIPEFIDANERDVTKEVQVFFNIQ